MEKKGEFGGKKVAYVFSSSGHTASYKLGCGILPRLEDGAHGAEVVGMFFFGDNTYLCARETRWASASRKSRRRRT